MCSDIYTIEDIKVKIQPVAEKYHTGNIYLFGSYARGEATSESDIDLRMDKGDVKGLFQMGALYSELEDIFEKNLDLLTTASLDKSFLDAIACDEVLLYEKQG